MKKTTLLLFALATGSVFSASAAEKVSGEALKLAKTDMPIEVATANEKSAASAVAAEEAVPVTKIAAASKSASLKADVAASFDEPEGFFTLGLTESLSGYTFAYRKGPAYQDMTWTNTSTGASSYVWSYTDPEFESTTNLVSSATDLTVNYPWATFDSPVLAASAEDGTTDTYDVTEQIGYFTGGDTELSDGYVFGISTYERPYYRDEDGYKFTYSSQYTYDVSGTSGFTNGTYSTWSDYLEDENYSKIELAGFANIFPAPASTYAITKMWCWINVTATAATSLNTYIIRIDDEGLITNDTIAYGTATIAAGTNSVVSFDLVTIDEDGFESTDPINIDSSIMVVIDGWVGNSAISRLYPTWPNGMLYTRAEGNDFERKALCMVDGTDADGNVTRAFYYAPWSYYTDDTYTTLIAVTDWMFMLDAEFWWIVSDADEYNFASASESQMVVTLDSYYSFSDEVWTIEEVDGADYSWLSFEAYNVPTTDGSGFSGEIQLTTTAAALPEGTTYREANLKFSYPGASKTIKFTQGESGVSSTVVDNSSTVKVDGENILINAADDVTGATVYSVTGQKVAETSVDGNATIDAAGLTDGLYIVKLNNGKTVKVIK